jgi:hypothetical protein
MGSDIFKRVPGNFSLKYIRVIFSPSLTRISERDERYEGVTTPLFIG